MSLVKICPKCGHPNDLAEMYCSGDGPSGNGCGFSVATIAATLPHSAPIAEDHLEETEPQSQPPRCVNGHAMFPDDLVCIECGGDVAAESAEAQTEVDASLVFADRYRVVQTLEPGAERADRYLAEPMLSSEPADRQDLLLIKHYPIGVEPDEEVQSILLSLESPRCVRLVETGHQDRRAFEVYESCQHETLADLSIESSFDEAFCRDFVDQMGTALNALHDAGLLHRDLQPANIGLRTLQPLDLVVSNYNAAAVAELEIHVAPNSRTSRYTAPECFAGISTFASDWWSLGVTLLERLTGGSLFEAIDARAFQLLILTRPVPIPEDLDDNWQTLLKGLLTRDHTRRWGYQQVNAWLAGESDLQHYFESDLGTEDKGAAICLGDETYKSAARYALAAASPEHWQEAVAQLASGELGTWLAEGKLDDRARESWDAIVEDHALGNDQQLMLALLAMNDQLPLCFDGEIVSPSSFAATAARSLNWLQGTIASHLMRISRELWFVDVAERREVANQMIQKREIPTDPARFDSLSLVVARETLFEKWAQRQSEWPEARHSALAHLLSKNSLGEADLLILLAAPLSEFRSAEDLVDEAEREAKAAGIDACWDREAARLALQQGRREVFETLGDRLSDFVRCGYPIADQWADTFRFEHRISLARALALLCVPDDRWQKPEGGEHWRLLMDFFRRKVLSSVQRGPLMSLKIGKSSARIDVAQLGSEVIPADSLIDAIITNDGNPSRVDPSVLAGDPILQRRLRRLRNNCENYQRDTGISSLHLGFPFLVRRDVDAGQSRPRLVPLLLWPVKLDYAEGQNTSLRIAADRDQERVRLNPAYGVLLSQEKKQRFADALLEIQCRDAITGEQLIEVLQPLFADSHEQVLAESAPLPAEPSLPKDVHCRVVASGVIFQCDFAGQELADELDKLQNLPFDASPAATLLRLDCVQDVEPSPIPPTEQRFLVTEADPSQEAAVFAARNPPGLLIQGPPGTGKSQTIVNIVADAVARGQTVLVVCQKQAALEVVGHRLESSGLGDRTVLIGDPSRDRKPFLARLRAELAELRGQLGRESAAAKHRTQAAEVGRLEAELDRIHEAMMHPVLQSGLTYEQVIADLIEHGNQPTTVSVSTLRPLLQPLAIASVKAIAHQIQSLAPLWLAARYENSRLHALKRFSADRETIVAVQHALDAFVECERKRLEELDATTRVVDINQFDMRAMEGWLSEHQTAIEATSEPTLATTGKLVDLFESGVADAELHRLSGLAADAQSNPAPESELRLRTKLAPLSDAEIDALHHDSRTVSRWQRSWLRKIWPPYHGAVSRIAQFCGSDAAQVTEEIAAIGAALQYESAARAGCRGYEQARMRLQLDAPVVNLSSQQLADKVRSLMTSLQDAKALIDRGNNCPCRDHYHLAFQSGTSKAIREFLTAAGQGVRLDRLRNESLETLQPLEAWFETAWIDRVTGLLRLGEPTNQSTDGIVAAWDSLAAFQTFRLRSDSISDVELSVLAAMAPKREVWESMPPESAGDLMRQTVQREALLAWRANAEEQWPWLLIEREEFESKVAQLRDGCKALGDAVRRLVPQLPAVDKIARRNRWDDILMFTGPRAKKLRETVDMGREFGLYQMRPIWLANPDTVSRIFPLQQGLFDVVVFDEASQLPVEYALPAIYRGKTIVVSGDEKQLPPAKFFAAAFDDEDETPTDLEGEELEDAIESRGKRREVKDCGDLLELASPVFPKVMLNVHYRSKYRQLIDFSNAAYYENGLSVPVLHPPEKVAELKPIEFVEVAGVYENQSNEIEADRVVDSIRTLWASMPIEETPTIGVVTFNLKQAELIEDKLELLAEQDDAFRQALMQQRNRVQDGERCGFFVKNVESVQGDERDWMIFSTTFGNNAQGSFRRNFGVLGQQGGERRLNVATTRAKHRMVIYSSMPLERISDTRQSLVAPQTPRDYLQAYLMYAKAVSDARFDDATRILGAFGPRRSTRSLTDAHADSFVIEVRSFLESEGYVVESPGANDAFRFDLAIRRPKDGMFAIAIECDSPRHPDLKYARHRELWRRDVLKATVPTIYRVWSRMWLVDETTERKRLLEAVKKAVGEA
ncbi:Serine/threonine-protein kinase PrkC [Rosistilla carotiformis]|uniref:Serine/threonine-protein kinase PrkC n=1 Tax=Rosistilla carotiformis TaxID=2528017 RepID=A0A518JTW3_9BACT|nr:AAA domain-containing protein [Rosistilla carotiformis]QDV68990.1 Serine/threonine-protein kinase PrkC [Rosistilla carotiformis]